MPGSTPPGRAWGKAKELDPKHARIPDLDKLDDIELGKYALSELDTAIEKGSKWHSREAFYAAVRAQAAVDLMHYRGCQLGLFDSSPFQSPVVPDDEARKARMFRAIAGE